jgi:hypothetical protein
MTLSKKHYERIATTIAEAAPAQGMPDDWSRGCNAGREYIAGHLANYFEQDNERFDRARFLAACGVAP